MWATDNVSGKSNASLKGYVFWWNYFALSRHPHQQYQVSKQGPVAVNLDLCEVTVSTKQELKQLLDEHRDVFANNDSEVGRTHRTQFHHISTQVPVAVKFRRTPFSLRSEVDQQIKNMEQRAIIEPYSEPILLVPKADASYRFYADFPALNDAIITEMFPLPFFRAWILFMGPCNLFTTLDLYSGY